MVHLAERPPSPEDQVQVLISTSTDVNSVRYVARIVGWDDKTVLPQDLGSGRARAIQRLIWALQPREGGLHNAAGGTKPSVNLLHVWRLEQMPNGIPVTELVNTKDGQRLAGGRESSGSWVYVEMIPSLQEETSIQGPRCQNPG
jgi:hypothetical protein